MPSAGSGPSSVTLGTVAVISIRLTADVEKRVIFDGVGVVDAVSGSVVGSGVDNVGSGAKKGCEPLRFPLQVETTAGFETGDGCVQDERPETRVLGIEESEASKHPSGQHDHHGEVVQSCLEQQQQNRNTQPEGIMKTEGTARAERERERE